MRLSAKEFLGYLILLIPMTVFSSAEPEYMGYSPTYPDQLVTDEALAQGYKFEQKKQWAEAVAFYLNYLKKDPSRVDLLIRISEIQNVYLKDYQASADTYRRITALEPKNDEVWFVLSKKYMNYNNYKDALEALNQAIQINPSKIEYYHERMMLEYWLGLYPQLKETFTYLLNKNPNQADALHAAANYYSYKSDWALAKYAFESYIKDRPEDKAVIEQFFKTVVASKDIKFVQAIISDNQKYFSPEQMAQLKVWLSKTEAEALKQRITSVAWVYNEAKRYGLEHEFSALSILDSGLLDENEKKYDEAIAHYQALVKKLPHIWEAWFRLALLYREQKKTNLEIVALEQLSKQFPRNLLIHQDLKNLYASGKHYAQLLREIKTLSRLNPNKSLDYLREEASLYVEMHQYQNALDAYAKILASRPNSIKDKLALAAVLSTTKQDELARQIYRDILACEPDNKQALLGVVTTYLDENNTDRALIANYHYLNYYPDDKKAILNSASMLTWIEAFHNAKKTLDRYRARFGEDEDYGIVLARLYAVSGRPQKALTIARPLLQEHPNNYDLRMAQTYADYHANHLLAAFDGLAELKRLKPDSKDTQDAIRDLHTPFKSNVTATGFHFKGSDTVGVNREEIKAKLFTSYRSSLLAGVYNESITATPSSQLTPVSGCCSLDFVNYWVGVDYYFSPMLDVDARIGNNQVLRQGNNLFYKADGRYRLNDYLQGNIRSSRSLYDTSPLAVSLGINQNLNHLNVIYHPFLQTNINVIGEYSTFSDTNRMWYTELNPHATVINGNHLRFDLGIDGNLTSFSQQLQHGYYSPSLYQFYSLIMTALYTVDPNLSYTVSMQIGEQKDENFAKFATGQNYSAAVQYGIYENWYWNLAVNYSNLLKSSAVPTTTTSPYHAYNVVLQLMRRL